MSENLNNRVAIVTGGASGLGYAIAQRLRRDGAQVIITDIDVKRGEEVAASDDFTFRHQDVTDELGWDDTIEFACAMHGGLHILVNNAGVLGPMSGASPEDTALDTWRQLFTINVESVFLGCRAAIKAMRNSDRGVIINLSSMADRLATPYATAYGAGKAAVRHLTTSVAQYCAEQKLPVRCNSVHPGMIRTPLLDRSISEIARQRDIDFDAVANEFSAEIPLGGFTRAEDVAAAVAFLAGDDARHITGSAIYVDGGFVHCNTFEPRR